MATIKGSDITELLNGTTGADSIFGGTGADTINAGAGNDYIEADGYLSGLSMSAVLGGLFSFIMPVGATPVFGTGTLGMVSGSIGAMVDVLAGGAGDDTYLVNFGGVLDTVTELAGEGIDTIRSLSNYTLGDNLENLELLTDFTQDISISISLFGSTLTEHLHFTAGAYNGTGNGLANLIAGNNLNNILSGLAGNDTLQGLLGNDLLDGGAGLDALVGGVGNDTYVVDNIGDVITELAGEGTDWVRSTIDYTLGAALENLELAAGGLTGTGNGLANLLDGSVAQDILKGLAGADTLHGLAGNDLLDGGEGIDALFGGSGNDTYLVDNIADMVTELAGDGADWIRSTVNVTLGDNVEYLSLLAEGLTGAGNALANSLYGSAGMDVLNGLAGNDILKGYAGNDMLDGGFGLDRLEGGLGNDTYLVDNIGDLVVEAAGQGADWVRSNISCTLAANVEYLTLLAGGLTGSGNALANVMYGSIGNDIFRGLGGNDMLKGYRGNDRYEFGVGDGLDAIEDVDTTAGNSDVLAFLPGINHDQLWFAQSGNDLRVSVMGTADQVTVKGWFNGAAGQIESIQSGDGKALLNTAVQQLVTAMSAFAPHAAGATGLTSAEHAALDGIIAASWS